MSCDCHKKDQRNCIEIVPIFSSLTNEEMLEVASITTEKTFKKNEMIYMTGDKGGKLYVLHTGRVKISRISINGKEQVIRVVGPGEFLGELSLFSPVLMTDNAEALETTTMCTIEGVKLKGLIEKYPTIAFKVMEELSERLEKAENLIETINLNTVEQRLAQSLLNMSEGKNKVTLNMNKKDLASQLGMSQETLSRKLTTFQEEGFIEQKGHRTIIIIDRESLLMLAND